MKKGLTELVFILDRSGSMSGLEADTIGGFNGLIEKQKKEDGEALVSVVLFDDRSDVIYDRVDLKKVEPMTDAQYYVRGCTALLDALGGAIHHITNVHRYIRREDVPEKTLFIITTDGMENASRRYTYDEVKRMVEERQKDHHWEFLFLGANIDAVNVAGSFGVKESRAVRFESDKVGTELNYRVLTTMVSKARRAETAVDMEADFDSDDLLAAIREDYADLEMARQMPSAMPVASREDREQMEDMLDQLSPCEQKVARMVYGLAGQEKSSVKETAMAAGISEGRVKQLASRILQAARKTK